MQTAHRSTKRVIVTRAAEDAARTAAALGGLGHTALAAPLTTIQPAGFKIPDGGFDAVIMTSSHAVSALPAGAAQRLARLPVFAVGGRTAARARQAGFQNVTPGAGGGAALAALVARAMPLRSRLLYLAGTPRKADLERLLPQSGFVLVTLLVYETHSAAALPQRLADILLRREADAALHFSRASASLFMRLAGAAGLAGQAQRLLHLCLSKDVALGLAGVPPGQIRVSAKPDEASLLNLLEERAIPRLSDSAAAVLKPAEPSETTGSRAEAPVHSMTDAVKLPDAPGPFALPRRAPVIEGAAADAAPPPSQTGKAAPRRKISLPLAFLTGAALSAAALIGGFGWKFSSDARSALQRAAAVEQSAAAQQAAITRLDQAGQALSARLDRAEAGQKAQADGLGSAARAAALAAPLSQQVGAIEQRLALLDRAVDAIRAADPAERIARIDARLGDLSKRLEGGAAAPPLASPTAPGAADIAALLAPLASRIDAAEARISGLLQLPGPQLAAQAAAAQRLTVIAAARTRFEAGAPLDQVILAMQALKLDTEALSAFVATGPPGLAALQQEFAALAPKLAPPRAQLQPEAGVIERLTASARTLVSPPAGSAGSDAAVKQADAALKAGNLTEAAAALQKLPGPAGDAARGFTAKITARLAALNAINRLESESLQSLAAAAK